MEIPLTPEQEAQLKRPGATFKPAVGLSGITNPYANR